MRRDCRGPGSGARAPHGEGRAGGGGGACAPRGGGGGGRAGGPAKGRRAAERCRRPRRSMPTPGAPVVADRAMNGFTSHLPKIVDRYRQLLALDALYDRGDLGVAGGGKADLRALVDDMAVGELDLGAASLEHVLAHGGTLQLAAPAAGRFRDEDGIDLRARGGIAVTRQNQLSGIELADLLELIAQGLADPHRLTADPDDEMADVRVPVDLAAGQAGGRRHAVAHGG